MNANLIIDAFCLERTKLISGNKVFPNTYLGQFEADVFEVTKSGYLYEYEVKISHSDFLAEKKKLTKRDNLLSGERCNYFTYLCPVDLISADEVPEYAGLHYITGVYYSKFRKMGNYGEADWNFPHLQIDVVKEPKRLSPEKLGNNHIHKLLESAYRKFHQRTIWNKYTYNPELLTKK